MKYLGKFYKQTIADSSLIKVVTTLYPILLYIFRSGVPFQQVLIHFRGICEGLNSHQFKFLSLQNHEELRNIWLLSLPALCRAFWTTQTAIIYPSIKELELLKNVCSILQGTSFMLYGNFTRKKMHARLEALEMYLIFYWEYYLIPNI